MGKTFAYYRIGEGLYVVAHLHGRPNDCAPTVELRCFASPEDLAPGEPVPSPKILLPRPAFAALRRSSYTFPR